jgi:membrane protein DedA with SNARE-associated domain
MLPVIRTFISLPAGVARMPFWRFTTLTLLGCIPWVFALALLGREVGSKWDDWKDRLHYLDYAVLAAIVALIVYAVWKRRRGRVEPPTDMRAHSDDARARDSATRNASEEQPVSR